MNKLPVGIFYPPPKSKGIIQILSNPFKDNMFLLLIESGDVCKVRIDKGVNLFCLLKAGIMEETLYID
jgi:hypothetical protein